MRFIIIASILFFAGCQQSMVKKTQVFMDYYNVVGQKNANGEYSFEECTQNFKKKHVELFGSKKIDFSKYNNELLKKLWGVSTIMSFHTLEQKYLSQAENIFENLKERNLDKEKCVWYPCAEEIFGLYIKFGDFSKAKQLKEKYPNILKSEPVPNVYEDNSILQKSYKLYDISSNGKFIKLTSIKMEEGPKIIALLSPTCHFAKLAMEAILSEPDLKNVFENHSLIIFPLNTAISPIMEIAKWNKDNPKLKYYIHSNRKDLRKGWENLSFTGTPAFYFLKNKQIVHQIGGWGPTEKEFKLDFRKGINQIGIPITYHKN